eukprot:4314507-Pleurochrysis_carterae.AAC.1
MAAATAASTMSAASAFLPAAARNCAAARAGTRTPSSDASTPSVLARVHATSACSSGARSSSVSS